jgi:GR25 family glycosyltransferase involved in LPS biosynthesis
MDFFKKCFVINLDRRPDRYDEFKSRIPFDSTICQRFSAIDGKTIPHMIKENPFVMGCHQSHKKILEIVMNDESIADDDFIIIFEDDVFFSKNFIKDIEYIKKSKDIIDLNSIIYIGGRFKISFKPSSYTGWSFLKNNLYLKYGNYGNISSPDYDRTTNVIILSKTACREIIEKTKNVKFSEPIDSLYNGIRKYIPEMKIYDLFPHLCYSPTDYKTDIQNYIYKHKK